MSNDAPQVLYTVQKVAELTQYSEETIRRALRAGELEASQVGRGPYRISAEALDAWWRGRGGHGLTPVVSSTAADLAPDAQRWLRAVLADTRIADLSRMALVTLCVFSDVAGELAAPEGKPIFMPDRFTGAMHTAQMLGYLDGRRMVFPPER